jgi:hypothetical protein
MRDLGVRRTGAATGLLAMALDDPLAVWACSSLETCFFAWLVMGVVYASGSPSLAGRLLRDGRHPRTDRRRALRRDPARRLPLGARAGEAISYRYESVDGGGHVRLETVQHIPAIPAFLRFQISDHPTGDPLEVAWPQK